MTTEKPIEWLENRTKQPTSPEYTAAKIIPAGFANQIRSFHRQIPGYKMSPLKALSSLAARTQCGRYLGQGRIGSIASSILQGPGRIICHLPVDPEAAEAGGTGNSTL